MYMNSTKKMRQLSKYIYFIRFCFILLHVTLRRNPRFSALFVALQIPASLPSVLPNVLWLPLSNFILIWTKFEGLPREQKKDE
jgi:hypothetical protein